MEKGGGREEGGGEGEGKTGEGYRPLIFHNTCNRDVAGMVQSEESSARMELQYHVRVVVTGPKWLSFEDFLCMSSFRDDERFVFIIHCACVPRAYLPWSLFSCGLENILRHYDITRIIFISRFKFHNSF